MFRYSSEGLFAVALVYTVVFDGFTNTSIYRELYVSLGQTLPLPRVSIYFLGFAVFSSAAVATARVSRLSGGEPTFRVFTPSLVPIAAGYEVAHNFPYIFRNLTQLLHLLGTNPVALTDVLPSSSIWIIQVALIVAGHLVAVAASHNASVENFERHRVVHLPVAVVMVLFTAVSLYIISRPVI